MVESSAALDDLFGALADGTRRAILAYVAKAELSVGEIGKHFDLTYGAISKHILVLEKAKLVSKERRGKSQIVLIVPDTVAVARKHIERYAKMWESRFDKLEHILKEGDKR
jgi:DNA-binding transcriptional ArsR family regulator